MKNPCGLHSWQGERDYQIMKNRKQDLLLQDERGKVCIL